MPPASARGDHRIMYNCGSPTYNPGTANGDKKRFAQTVIGRCAVGFLKPIDKVLTVNHAKFRSFPESG